MYFYKKNLRFDDLFETFIRQCRSVEGKSPATIRNYRQNFELLKKFKPDIKLLDLTPELMGSFFEFLQNRKRMVGNKFIVRNLKNSSVATVRGKLNVFFDWLIEYKYLKINPFKGIKYPAFDYTDRRAFTKDEIDKIYLAINRDIVWENQLLKKRNTAFFMMLLYTGIRKGEILGLKLFDLDLKNRLLTIRAETSKSKRTRIIPINSELVPHLEEYLAFMDDYTTGDLWVSSNNDRHFTEHGLKHLINHLNQATGVNCHVHRFRHTFATNYYAQTHDIVNLKKLLGHRDMKMTLSYLRSLPDDDAISQMGKFTLAKVK
ncbi:MAG: tyrosine-type recombinase/integrase [Patescibacteria group bacterium]